MNVSTVNSLNPIYAGQGSREYSNVQQTQSQPNKLTTDSVTISEQGKNAQSNWQNIAANYNVNNITGADARQLSKDLFEGGFIGRGEMMAIGAPMSMNENPYQTYDLLGDMRYTFDLTSSMGGHNKASSEFYLKSIDVLTRLKQTRDDAA